MRLLSHLSPAAVSREPPVAQRKRTCTLAFAANCRLEWLLTAAHSRCLEPQLSWENNLGITSLINRGLRDEWEFRLKREFEAHVICQVSNPASKPPRESWSTSAIYYQRWWFSSNVRPQEHKGCKKNPCRNMLLTIRLPCCCLHGLLNKREGDPVFPPWVFCTTCSLILWL